MDYKVILSPRAIQDLEEIVRYIAFDNPVRAESFGRELINKTKMLANFPELGRVVPENSKSALRRTLSGGTPERTGRRPVPPGHGGDGCDRATESDVL